MASANACGQVPIIQQAQPPAEIQMDDMEGEPSLHSRLVQNQRLAEQAWPPVSALTR